VTRLAARPAAAARLRPAFFLAEGFGLRPVLFLEVFLAEAAFPVALLLPADDPVREPPRDADFLVLLFRPPAFRAEVVRLREPAPPFLPPLEPPRDDFLAAAMISAPR
jgi:hypothetical protein